MDLQELRPDTPLSELTAGDLVELIGWALTQYKAAEAGDVSGFAFRGFSPALPAFNDKWGDFQSQWWARTSGPAADAGTSGLQRRR